jgi:hypothetical protein
MTHTPTLSAKPEAVAVTPLHTLRDETVGSNRRSGSRLEVLTVNPRKHRFGTEFPIRLARVEFVRNSR